MHGPLNVKYLFPVTTSQAQYENLFTTDIIHVRSAITAAYRKWSTSNCDKKITLGEVTVGKIPAGNTWRFTIDRAVGQRQKNFIFWNDTLEIHTCSSGTKFSHFFLINVVAHRCRSMSLDLKMGIPLEKNWCLCSWQAKSKWQLCSVHLARKFTRTQPTD